MAAVRLISKRPSPTYRINPSGAKKGTVSSSSILSISNALSATYVFFKQSMLSDAKGTILKDIVETCPELIAWLTARRLPELKKELWYSYFSVNADLVSDLCIKYEALSREIDAVSLDDTPWKRALEIYKKRFDVPFEMEITNLKGAIIGESIPRVEFSFSRDGQTVTLSRDKLDELDTLSQGEKRALLAASIP